MKKNIRELIERNKRDDRSAFVSLPTRCHICALPVENRQAVEKSLTEGGTSLEAIARTWNIGKASVWRHAKNHLVPQVKQQLREAVLHSHPEALEATKTIEDFQDINARAEIIPLYQKAKALLKSAEDAMDYQAVKGFLSESRQILELCARLDGKLNGEGGAGRPQVPIVVWVVPVAVVDGRAVEPQTNDAERLQVGAPRIIDVKAQK